MPARIPDTWKASVCKVLRTGDEQKIHLTLTARNDWASTFPNAWRYSLYGALEDALSARDIQGERRSMDEEGETYEFFFTHAKTRLYGKINLLPSGDVIIIYSAHKPRFGDRL
jgi:hypothetical protein